jgi:hypothetical protein
VREKFLAITGRFATLQAQSLNVHVDLPFWQRLALPITLGTNSLFHHQTMPRPKSELEAVYHEADVSIRNVIQLIGIA